MNNGPELFPVAIGDYIHFNALDVDAEINALSQALSRFEVCSVAWTVPTDRRGADGVDARLDEWAVSADPHTILYWVGHGWSDGITAALAHRYSPSAVRSKGITPQRIADAIATRISRIGTSATEDSAPHWMIIVIDTCQSAMFVRLLKNEISQRPGRPRFLLIGGLSGEGATDLGRFSRELAFFLETACAAESEIPLHMLARYFETVNAEVEQKRLLDNVVLRRRHAMWVNIDLDARAQLLAVLDTLTSDQLQHFVPKAHGGEMPFAETMLGEQSWYFQGRHSETAHLASWLTERTSGLFVLTGPAGSGKSALLGHLVVHTHPALRQALQRARLIDTLSESEQAPAGVFDAVMHLTGATTREALDRITFALIGYLQPATELSGAVEALVDCLSEREQQVTILIDALDEAVEPLVVAEKIVRVLARVPGVRMLVGTRASTREAPDRPATDTDLLDALGGTNVEVLTLGRDKEAVARYVRQRLRLSARFDAIQREMNVDDFVNAIRERDPQFLFARLLVHEVLAESSNLRSEAWAQLLIGDHRNLFSAAVNRLAAMHPANLAGLRALAFGRGRGLPAIDGIWGRVAQSVTGGTELRIEDIDRLTKMAAPYILTDREHGQTVFRLAHRTFAEHFTNETDPSATDREAHLAITSALIGCAADTMPGLIAGTHSLNPYLMHHLPAHAAAAGQTGWSLLEERPDALLALAPEAIASNAVRSAFARYPLPPTISAITAISHQLQDLDPAARYLPVQITRSRQSSTRPDSQGSPWSPHVTFHSALFARQSAHRTLHAHAGKVRALAAIFLPDGRTLLASAGADKAVRLWDPATGTPQGTHLTGHTEEINALTSIVLPDGRVLLATAGNDSVVRLWDPVTATPYGTPLIGHKGAIWALESLTLPDGRPILASGGSDSTVRLWDPVTCNPYGSPLSMHKAGIWALTKVILPDGHQLLAAAGHDNDVYLWSAATGKLHGTPLVGHTRAIRALTSMMLPDGSALLISAGSDTAAYKWNPETGEPVGQPITHYRWVRALTTLSLPDGTALLASADDNGEVRLSDPITGEWRSWLSGHNGTVWALTSVPLLDGRNLLASAGSDGTVRLWDSATAPQGQDTLQHTGTIRSMISIMLPGEKKAVASCSGKLVLVWDPAEATTQPMIGTTGTVRSLAPVTLANGRSLLATAGDDKLLRLWDPNTGSPYGTPLAGHTNTVLTLANVSMPDGRNLLASGGADETVRLWDPNTGFPHGDRIKGHGRWVQALTTIALPGGRRLLASASGKIIRLWDPATGKPHRAPLVGHTGNVLSLAAIAQADGRMLLASGGSDNVIRLWEPLTGEPHSARLTNHSDGVRALVEVDTFIASAGDDGVVYFWEAQTDRSESVMEIPVGHPIRGLCVVGGLLAIAIDGIVLVRVSLTGLQT